MLLEERVQKQEAGEVVRLVRFVREMRRMHSELPFPLARFPYHSKLLVEAVLVLTELLKGLSRICTDRTRHRRLPALSMAEARGVEEVSIVQALAGLTRAEAAEELEVRRREVEEGAHLVSMKVGVEEEGRLQGLAVREQAMLGEEAPFQMACAKSAVESAASCQWAEAAWASSLYSRQQRMVASPSIRPV